MVANKTRKRRPAQKKKTSTGKKWGKLGAPGSAQRKAWMRKIRSKRKKYTR